MLQNVLGTQDIWKFRIPFRLMNKLQLKNYNDSGSTLLKKNHETTLKQ